MWAHTGHRCQVRQWNEEEEKQNANQIVISIECTHSIVTPGGNGFFSFHLYFTEWRHHCYNNLVKATLKCILLLHGTPTASDTSTIIILFIKWFHISHAALFHYYMYEPWKCDLLSAKYTTDTLYLTSHSVFLFLSFVDETLLRIHWQLLDKLIQLLFSLLSRSFPF